MSLQSLKVTGTVSFFKEHLYDTYDEVYYQELPREKGIEKAIYKWLLNGEGRVQQITVKHTKPVGIQNEEFSNKVQAEVTFEAHEGLFNNDEDLKKALSEHWSKICPHNNYSASWLKFEHENKKSITLIEAPVSKVILGSIVSGNKLYSHWESMEDASLTFESDRKLLFIYFVDNSQVYRLELASNSDLNADILVTKISEKFTWVQFLLHHACRLSKAYIEEDDFLHFLGLSKVLGLSSKAKEQPVKRLKDVFEDNSGIIWERVTETSSCCDFVLGNSSALTLLIPNETEEIINNQKVIRYSVNNVLGRFAAQRFQIQYTRLEKQQFELEDRYKRYNLKNLRFRNAISNHDRFTIVWGHAVLLSKGFHVFDQEEIRCGRSFQDKIEDYISNPQQLSQVLAMIAGKVEDDYFTCIHKALDYFMSSTYEQNADPLLPQCKMVRRIVCTPTKVIFYPPQPTFENRILREFEPEFALRLSFRDEDFRKLNRIPSTNEAVYEKSISSILLKGITIADRTYQFLACSNSQLRDHAVWMYSKDSHGRTAIDIQHWMGNLDKIDCVATYVARMGQCFSNTKDSGRLGLMEGAVQKEIPDIERNGHCFSDGIGKISMELAKKVCEDTGREYVHSVYQIRFGGCKGTVAVDPTLEGKQILVRKSMKKFDSPHDNLEIANYSKPGKLCLNHQAITLLSQMGVPDNVFLNLQERVLQDLTDMYFYDNKAATMLNGRATSSRIKFKQMLVNGVNLTTEPFFIQMLHAVGRSYLRDLLTRARIELPHSHARNMIGALDETQTLQSGQVFIQYSGNIDEPNKKLTILKGTVVVTKFPALHPGDVRKLEAVDVPELHHMKDCIIFPSLGSRPHPNEMSGSDLDGDEYFVTWLDDLIFPKGNYPPMDFPTPQKKTVDGQIKLNDMADYIKDYIKNDRLGLIANAHKALADFEDKGIFSPVCLKLAEKHSEAVDFAKTGKCPDLDAKNGERPEQYPAFMGKQGQSVVYRSKHILGKLYWNCRGIKEFLPISEDNGNHSSDVDPKFVLPGSGKYIDHAKRICQEYSSTVRAIMTRYGIQTEAELITGCITKLHIRLREKNDRHETIQLVSLQLIEVKKKYREEFLNEFDDDVRNNLNKPQLELLRKASAWYQAAYIDKENLRSFPWIIVSDLLAAILKRSPEVNRFTWSTRLDKLTQQIIDIYLNFKHISGKEYADSPMVFAYANRYPSLLPLFYVIKTWCSNTQIVGSKIHQVSSNKPLLLLIYFAQRDKFIPKLLTNQQGRKFIPCVETNYAFYEKCVNGQIGDSTISKLLVEFLKYLSSHIFPVEIDTSFSLSGETFKLNRKQKDLLFKEALIARHRLAVLGVEEFLIPDKKLSYNEDHFIEETKIIPKNIWIKIRQTCQSYENGLKQLIPEGIHELTIRSDKHSRKPQGILWARGDHEAMSALHYVIDEWITNFNRILLRDREMASHYRHWEQIIEYHYCGGGYQGPSYYFSY